MSKQLDLIGATIDAIVALGLCDGCSIEADHFAAARCEFTGQWRAYCRTCAEARGVPWQGPPCWRCHKRSRVLVGRVLNGVPRFLCTECAA